MGVCVPNFWSVSLLVWPGGVTQTNKYIRTYTSEFKNILNRLLASRGFRQKQSVMVPSYKCMKGLPLATCVLTALKA